MTRRSPPQYSTQDPSGSSARRGHLGGAQSDHYDDDDDDNWTLNGSEMQRLENDAVNQYQQRTGLQAPRTPSKRSHFDMNGTGLPTPQTDTRQRSGYTNGAGASSKRRATDAEFLNLVSPATTPSPIRFRDALTGTGDDALFDEIQQAVSGHGGSLNPDVISAVTDICNRSTLRTQGVIKG
jgi:hypothetical protein